MSSHNIGLYKEISKIIPELSSNMHLISSSVPQINFHLSKLVKLPLDLSQALHAMCLIRVFHVSSVDSIRQTRPCNIQQYFTAVKNDNFQMKNCDIFLIFAQNIDHVGTATVRWF